MPFFFLLVDSWLLSAGAAGEPELAGCVVSEDAGAASEEFAAGAGNEPELPGVTVSTVAEFPPAEPTPIVAVGSVPKESVSSPISPEGVMVGAPVCDAVETSGLVLTRFSERPTKPGRSFEASSFCIRAT